MASGAKQLQTILQPEWWHAPQITRTIMHFWATSSLPNLNKLHDISCLGTERADSCGRVQRIRAAFLTSRQVWAGAVRAGQTGVRQMQETKVQETKVQETKVQETKQTGGFLTISGARLDYRLVGPHPADAPTIVMLHEGLGSLAQWGDMPAKLVTATGAGVLAYSRQGYGQSSPVALPRPLDYLDREALDVLPQVLDAVGVRRGVLFGHSDGATIAAIHAARVQDPRITGISMVAPHFFVEEIAVAAIAEAKAAYDAGELKRRLARHHADVEGAFRGWNDTWLDPRFRAWNIIPLLRDIQVPVQVMQGETDQYATLQQVHVVGTHCRGPVDMVVMPGVGHSPHREAPELTLQKLVEFCGRTLNAQGSSAC